MPSAAPAEGAEATTNAQGPTVPRIGAAVYIPAPRPGTTTEEREVACLPSDEAYPYDDTINRAELAAAYKAITMRCRHIATDSLAAIYQIHRMVTRPQDICLGFHRHAALLQQIVSPIAAGGRPIHLYKVKSHIGIPGNEHADEIATSVAKGTRKADEVISTPSNSRPNMAWPHRPETQEPGKEVPTPPQPVRDVASLHTMAHKCHRFGGSNTNAICFSAAQETARDTEKVSHAFLTSTAVTYRELVNALKVRTGTFYSQKRAWWYGRATSDKCVLCGQPDGTMHSVSGCPDLSLAVTKRHNEAVLLIAKAILTGENGAQVVAMDVSKAAQKADGLQTMTQFLPARILPPSMPAEEKEALVKAHKPDMVLYRTNTDTSIKHSYTFVEVKYCRDTQPQDQVMHAREQHHSLLQAIRKYSSNNDTEIQLAVIPLGVAGTVYTSAKKLLQESLGVSSPALDTLLRNLHLHAVRSLTNVIRYRRIKMGTRLGKQWRQQSQAAGATCVTQRNSGSGSSSSNAAKNGRKRQGPRLPKFKRKKTQEKEGRIVTSNAYGWGWGDFGERGGRGAGCGGQQQQQR